MYRHKIPGKGEMRLCYRCKHWVDRHPGVVSFPPKNPPLPPEKKRIRTFSIIYIISSFGVFFAGGFFLLIGRPATGLVLLLGAASLFLAGRGMRKFTKDKANRIPEETINERKK
jgi:hypothetical protein